MRKILCFLDFHKWIYESDSKRKCKYCQKLEIFINGSPISGLADDSYWTSVKKSQKPDTDNKD